MPEQRRRDRGGLSPRCWSRSRGRGEKSLAPLLQPSTAPERAAWVSNSNTQKFYLNPWYSPDMEPCDQSPPIEHPYQSQFLVYTGVHQLYDLKNALNVGALDPPRDTSTYMYQAQEELNHIGRPSASSTHAVSSDNEDHTTDRTSADPLVQHMMRHPDPLKPSPPALAPQDPTQRRWL